MEEQRNGISRRAFIRRVGTVGALAAAPGLLAACGDNGGTTAEGNGDGAAGAGGGTEPANGQTPANGQSPVQEATGEPLRVGLLIPTSGVYASLGRDMENGWRLYLDQHGGGLGGRPLEIFVEDTEANPEVGLRAAQKLLREDQAQLVTGIVSSAVALGVRDLFDESGVPLIISNAGANAITGDARSPSIFRTSFSNWQSSYSLGQYFFDNVAEEAYVIAPDYAAGHEDVAAFREAFEGAGGQVMGESYPPFGSTDDYQPFLSEIRASGAPAVFAFFAGGEAVLFVQQYQDFGLKDSIPLLGPGFLTDDGVLEAQGPAALGLQTSLHYTPYLDNPTNEAYRAAYEEAYGDPPTVYSVQSYDAAALADLSLQELDGDTSDLAAWAQAMENVGTIDSPRGQWEMDPETHNPIQDFYLREVQEVDGGLGNIVIESLGTFTDPG